MLRQLQGGKSLEKAGFGNLTGLLRLIHTAVEIEFHFPSFVNLTAGIGKALLFEPSADPANSR